MKLTGIDTDVEALGRMVRGVCLILGRLRLSSLKMGNLLYCLGLADENGYRSRCLGYGEI